MKIFVVFIFFYLFSSSILAQVPNVGLRISSNDVSDGYLLYSPQENTKVFLIDNCGEQVNEWSFGERPGLVCYLLENGNLLRAGRNSIEIQTWEGDLVWSYLIDEKLGLTQHHDIEFLPNGNVLCLITDFQTSIDMFNLGKDTLSVPGEIKLDKIIELQPIGMDSAIVVWEWRFMDHFIQDFDSTKINFGVIADHPELLDINYDTPYGTDYTHCNAIDYNADLDQILISARSINEIMIIDHSTITAEAASHSGGASNRGGDFLWRWGNPAVYDNGNITDQKLFLQHDPKWIPNSYADAGRISVFSNGGDTSSAMYSSLLILEPTVVNGAYQMNAGKFLPLDYYWSWNGDVLGETVFQGKKSGMNVMPNGNVAFCETFHGQVTELNRLGEILWVYKNPSGSIIYGQLDTIQNFNNSIFRGERLPASHPGLQGKDLSGKGILEDFNALSDSCGIELPTALPSNTLSELAFFENPVKDKILQFTELVFETDVMIYDWSGRLVFALEKFSGRRLLIDLSSGMYILRVLREDELLEQQLMVY